MAPNDPKRPVETRPGRIDGSDRRVDPAQVMARVRQIRALVKKIVTDDEVREMKREGRP